MEADPDRTAGRVKLVNGLLSGEDRSKPSCAATTTQATRPVILIVVGHPHAYHKVAGLDGTSADSPLFRASTGKTGHSDPPASCGASLPSLLSSH